jgi:hypothetical protein
LRLLPEFPERIEPIQSQFFEKGGEWFTLSPRERAGVRGKVIKFNQRFPISTAPGKLGHSPIFGCLLASEH